MDVALTPIQIVYTVGAACGLFLLGVIAVGVWKR